MGELENPVVVDFPLRGEWVALQTPARRIPSHGTNALGQRYAFDFLRTDHRRGVIFFRSSLAKYWLAGIPTSDCYCWQEVVRAPFDGEVVAARDGMRERKWLHPLVDLLSIVGNAVTAKAKVRLFGVRSLNVDTYVGNHVILKRDSVYALFAHLTTNSVAVEPGQRVRVGDGLGKVGHTGNSTAPHLHFQLMNSADLLSARGIPCAFREYEVFDGGKWNAVVGGIPGYNVRIRSVQ